MKLDEVKLDPECYLARNCTLLGDITIGKHSSVYPGVVMRAEREPITIGANTNIQDNCVIHVEYDFPCTIGNNVTVGHNATVRKGQHDHRDEFRHFGWRSSGQELHYRCGCCGYQRVYYP